MNKKVRNWLFIGLVFLVSAFGICLAVATHTPSTLETAKEIKARYELTKQKGVQLGMSCHYDFEVDDCANIVSRAEKNPALRDALLKAKESGVEVKVTEEGYFSAAGTIGAGVVEINTRASDKKIIAFLTK